jgi:excisionase family DNA binding protein
MDLLTPHEAAARLTVSIRTVLHLCSYGVLPHQRAGGRIGIDPGDLEGYLVYSRVDASEDAGIALKHRGWRGCSVQRVEPRDHNLITIRQIAERLGITPTDIRKFLRSGLVHYRLGTLGAQIRIDAADLDAYLEAHPIQPVDRTLDERRQPMPELEESFRAIGRRLQQLRTLRGLRQVDLAKAVGVSAGWISWLERGIYCPSNRRSYSVLVKIAAVLEVTINELWPDAGRGA